MIKIDSDAEEIWTSRLRKDVDVREIKDKQSLLFEIDDTPESYVSKTGKRVDLTQAKKNLKNNVEDLFSGSKSLRSDVYDTNISDLKKAKTKDDTSNIEDRFVSIPNMDFDSKQLFRGDVAVRERELLKEAGVDVTREQIIGTGLKSVRKLSGELDLSIDETKDVLTRKGFTLIRDETTFKK